MTATGCDSGSPCIASIPGPTSAGWYWTSTTGTTGVVDEYYVNIVNFYDGAAGGSSGTGQSYVGAVRSGS